MEEKECKGLSHGAYGDVPGEEYEPYIPPEKEIPELSVLAVILGIILSVVFGITMVYLGLKIGMTVSASIPAAVISMGILKGIFKRGTILENNIVQTMTVSGEAVAAGLIFTIPAAFLWPEYEGFAHPLSMTRLFLIALIGGVLGVLLMIPLRNYLIVKEHGKLKYPEGTACAEVLVAGDVGGNPAKLVFASILVGGIYKILQQSLKMWKEVVSIDLPIMKNAVLSAELSPILLGVGYIIGIEVAFIMLAGGLLAWLVIIPLITYIGSGAAAPIAPETAKLISAMTADEIRNQYVRYIGAGAVAAGGLISLAKSMPVIWSSFKSAFIGLMATFGNKEEKIGKQSSVKRTIKDLPIEWCLLISGILIIMIVLTKNISTNLFLGAIGALLVFIFGFFFVTVSSRMVGLVGSSSNPVSGMTIGTLIVSTLIFHSLGFRGIEGMVTSLVVGAFVCIAMCMAGDISQDLKTGFLIGSTPWRLQLAQIIGTFSSALFVVWMVLSLVPFIAPKDGVAVLQAPQANLMAILIKGIMSGNLPWVLIFTGVFIAIIVELVGVSALAFAIGLYLPLSTSAPFIVGGFLAWFLQRKYASNPTEFKERNEKGVLVSSGLIAGDALMGLLVLILTAKDIVFPKVLPDFITQSSWTAIIAYGAATLFLWYNISGKEKTKESLVAPICDSPTQAGKLTSKEIDDFGNPIINIPYHTDESIRETSGEKKEEDNK
jgi:putative OPT family oligopeptide transporter